MHINQEKIHSKKVFHFENIHNLIFITFIQDKNPDFFPKACHPQNNLCTLLSLDFIETVFVLLLFKLIMICTFHKTHLFIPSHTVMLDSHCFVMKNMKQFLNTPMFCIRTQDLRYFHGFINSYSVPFR